MEQTMKTTLLYFLLCMTMYAHAQYNPEAGRIPSFTEEAKLFQSSGSNINFVNDNNHHTYWESSSSLPDGYISRPDLNSFHIDNPKRIIDLYGPAFDGNLNTKQQFNQTSSNQKYTLYIPFKTASKIKIISLKLQLTSAVKVTLQSKIASVFAGIIQKDANFMLQNLKVSESYAFDAILIESDEAFGLFELACLNVPPFEYVAFDFGSPKKIQQIWTRHMSGNNVLRCFIDISDNAIRWYEVAELNPLAITFLPTILNKQYLSRFLRIRYELNLDDYGKALLWEVKVYDSDGPFGPSPAFTENKLMLSERLGINGIWGWGYNTYSDNIPKGSGPEMYRSTASKARNYHELSWDINKTGLPASYDKMAAGEGTQATWWLNWDREYNEWKSKGFSITATIQFKGETIPESQWTDPENDAYRYSFDFANHFGSKNGNGLIDLVEIGNEPWDYRTGFYPLILKGMLKGMKDADQSIRVIPAAFQATFRKHEGHDYNNFLSENVDENTLHLLDGLNGHFYSHTYGSDGIRISVHPEDPRSDLHSCKNILRFRDKNMPGKPVFVTEYGFDSQGGGEDCIHAECVTVAQQAAWGLRSAIMLLRNGIEEVYWYFFANEFTASFMHTRSGFTGSVNTGFEKKQSFIAFQQINEILGKTHLVKVLSENNACHSYLFENKQTGELFALAWRPVGGDPAITLQTEVNLPYYAARYQMINGLTGNDWKQIRPTKNPHLLLSGFPMVIELQEHK